MLKGVLFLLLQWFVRPTRHGTDFAHLHTDAFQEGTDLGRRAPNAGEAFNLSLRLGHRAWWMGAEVCFEGGLMRIECAGLPGKVEVLEAFDALILIQMQDRHKRLAGNAAQARNFLVRQALAFQVHHFHALLHQGRGMMIAFVRQSRNLGVGKSDLNHDILIRRSSLTTNTSIHTQR